jgi:flagellar biosynthesis/type III secretory pathway protein FliH|tara:strand:- start:1240 stop:1476 length:237 start_codon:yes stop_codon:yes gene_type:complete
MIDIRIIGNDILLSGERVARIFDIRATLRSQLLQAIDVASGINLDLQEIKENSYEQGKEEGYEEGWRKGYDEGYFKES